MIVVSHRGPYRFVRAGDDGFALRRGAGGVVSALGPLLEARDDATWIAAAMSATDRDAVASHAVRVPGIDLHLIALDPHLHRLHYDVVSNGLLWPLYHGLLDLAYRPVFDGRAQEAWDGYVEVNRCFADATASAAPDDDLVLVQDYQLALVPALLRAVRPDLRIVHFTHTPFCGPNSVRVLPDATSRALCESMSAVPCGFHTARWARSYRAAAHEVLGPVTAAPVFDASFGPDPEALAQEAADPSVDAAGRVWEDAIGDRAVIVRSDRVDPSKNIVRGFAAYDLLLARRPDLRGRVVFLALLNPSREGLAEYLAYRQEVDDTVARVNERWATPGWTPIVLDTRDDYARSLAGLARADVILVNPVRDGLNLVAKEGPLVNRRDAVLCLSREAGAFVELHDVCLPVHPFDVVQTASALAEALAMDPSERAARAKILRVRAAARTPAMWLDAQIAAADGG